MFRDYVGEGRLRKAKGVHGGEKYPIPNVWISSADRWDCYRTARDATNRSEEGLTEVIRIGNRMVLQQNCPSQRDWR